MSKCPTCGHTLPDGVGKLGQRIAKERIRQGFSLRQASAAWGVPFANLDRYQKGGIPNGLHLATLIGVFGLKPSEVAELFSENGS